MINANLNSFGTATFVAQIIADLDASINEDVFMYLTMTGGWSAGNRVFTFDKNNTIGRKVFYLIKENLINYHKIENLNAYIEVTPVWANSVHHTDTIPVFTDDVQTGTTDVDVLNKNYYQVIERGEQMFIKLTDGNTELLNLCTFTDKKANEITFTLPVIEEEIV